MTINPIARLAALVAVLAGAPPALAACDLDIRNIGTVRWAGSGGRNYDVFDPATNAQVVTFEIRHRGDACAFIVAASYSPGAGGARRLAGPGGTLDYQLYVDRSLTRVLKDLPGATPQEVIVGAAPAGNNDQALEFVMSIPPLQVVAAGTYEDELDFSVYEGVPGAATLRDQRRVRFEARVDPVVQFTFAAGTVFDAAQRSARVDFGVMQAGTTRDLGLGARGNTYYRISLSSENRGVMRHVDPGDNSVVPYALSFDGRPIPLNQHSAAAVEDAAPTDAVGRRHTFQFTVGDLGTASAGDYQDVITVTMTAR
jgi:spore coat protein U-like protein